MSKENLLQRSTDRYDASAISSLFQGMLFSPRVCRRREKLNQLREEAEMDTCKSCHESIIRCNGPETDTLISEQQSEEHEATKSRLKPYRLPLKHATGDNSAFAPIILYEPLRFHGRRSISLGDPQGMFCAMRSNGRNVLARGVLSLTGNVLIWDQRPATPLEHIPNDVLNAIQ